MLTFGIFYRDRGLRIPANLLSPRLTDTTTMVLPLDSIYHSIDHDEESIGVEESDPVVGHYSGNIVAQHVLEYSADATAGTPRPNALQPAKVVMQYHTNHRRIKRAEISGAILKQPKTLLVYNYGVLDQRYRYNETPFTDYNRWLNFHVTMVDTISKLAGTSERQQYIPMDVPTPLPPLSALLRATNRIDRPLLDMFNTPTKLFMLDLFVWAGPDRAKSTLSKLSPDALKKINLLWRVGAKYTVMNLGTYDSWIKTDQNKAGTMSPQDSQKRLLRFMMSLLASITVMGDDGDDGDFDDGADDGKFEEGVDRAQAELDDAIVSISGEVDDITGRRAKIRADNKLRVTREVPVEKKSVPTAEQEDILFADDKGTEDKHIENIDADLAELEKIHAEVKPSGYQAYTPPNQEMDSEVVRRAEKLASRGLLTAAEVRRMKALAGRFRTIKNPHGEGMLAEHLKITPEELAVPEEVKLVKEMPGVVDPSMLNSSLEMFDRHYIENILTKDISNMVMSIQQSGIAVQNYTVERVEDVADCFEMHTVSVVPPSGKASTLRFRLPVVNEDGVFKAAGTKFRMRKQRSELPIRKVSPDSVSLTSYHSKMSVNRTERAMYNYVRWIGNELVSANVDPDNLLVSDLKLSEVFDNQAHLPRVYSAISYRITSFKSGVYTFYFDWSKRKEIFGETKVVAGKFVPVGTGAGTTLFMDYDNVIYETANIEKEGTTKRLGLIEEITGLDLSRRPVEYAELDIFGTAIPIGVVLAHHIGLGNLLATLNTKHRRVAKGAKSDLTVHEFIVKFQDESLIFDRNDPIAVLVFNGINRYRNDIKRFSIYDFDKQDVFSVVFDSNKIVPRYERELRILHQRWVDPITKGLLLEMQEPTDLFNLYISAVKKLTTDHHPDPMDNLFQRDRGYERFAGILYGELSAAIRSFEARPNSPHASVDLNPQAVWFSVLQDQTVMPTEESNPIHGLKEKEVVVFRGAGGRSARSMTSKNRTYHANGLGVVSEATVDNGDVATISYLTADPNYSSVRGTIRKLDGFKGKAARCGSTSMMLAPGAEHDSSMRVNFTSIQNSQTTHCENYITPPSRTGYERILAQRVDAIYASVAKKDGEVEAVTDKVVTVGYKDGTKKSYPVGRQFGNWSGKVIPHDLKASVKVGDRVARGDVLAYNTRFFAHDHLYPKQVLYKSGVMCRVALMENTGTLEDSCEISQQFADKLITMSTHIRPIKVKFDQEIRNLVEVGDDIDFESILCTLHDVVEGNSALFNDEALDTLKSLAQLSPKAKYTGKIDKIDVVYTGEPEDMSPSLRALTDKSDEDLYRTRKQMKQRPVDGHVEVGYRVNGIPMEQNTAMIRVYISGPTSMGIGDKLVFGSQMKSIVGRVLGGKNTTADGGTIDAYFSYYSLLKRQVESPIIMGTSNTLAMHIAKLAVKAYKD